MDYIEGKDLEHYLKEGYVFRESCLFYTSGPSFTIGKERSRVNYCISDNTSVSRCHAKLVRRGAQYFITDMNSTTYTFVNGVKVIQGQDVALNDRDMIRIADEDFEFHMN